MSKQAMFRMGKIMQLVAANQGRRTIHSSAALSGVIDSKMQVAPAYAKIKAKQEHFQIPDDTPVHLKGGPMDHILMYTTLALIIIAGGMSIEFIYTAAFPKKG